MLRTFLSLVLASLLTLVGIIDVVGAAPHKATPTPTPTPAVTVTAAKTPTSVPTATATTGDLVLYDNAIRNGFSDVSFDYSTLSLCDSSHVVSPSCAITALLIPGGAISFGRTTALSTAPYRALEWYVDPSGVPLDSFITYLIDASSGAHVVDVPLSSAYVRESLPNGYLHLSVPLSQLNPAGVPISAVRVMRNTSANRLPTIALDEVRFVVTPTPVGTPTPTPTISPTPSPTPRPTPSPTPTGSDPVIAAAGDIACDPTDSNYNGGMGTATLCRQRATSDLLAGLNLTAVLALGDEQYDVGSLAAFQQSYNASWGRVKAITYPVPGNHEYGTSGASGYFAYFGTVAGDPARGYYSFDLGSWHLIALNSECGPAGGCDVGSPQEVWLRADLAAHRTSCTLAYWHEPRYSSGWAGNDSSYAPFWQALYDYRADLVLSSHNHVYERFAPQDAAGVRDPQYGLRQFIVGTGGEEHFGFGTIQPNSEVRNADTFGVLVLTLHATGYDWRFVPEAGKTFTDSGSGSCHRAATATGSRTSGSTASAPAVWSINAWIDRRQVGTRWQRVRIA